MLILSLNIFLVAKWNPVMVVRIKQRITFFLFLLLASAGVTRVHAQATDPETRLAEMGITLAEPAAPTANFVLAVQTGNLIFLSGHGPMQENGEYMSGKVGEELDLTQAAAAARLTGISLLTSLKAQIGSLNRVKRIVKVLGMVNAVPDFTQHPQVMNGFSDFMVEVFGEKGKHARSAVGMGSLPFNIPVEIEMIVELHGE
ncbi:Enamine deaminase RidA, house cleaning of reactive enamine intermediates, YjgF/YER057c/UK114 family [Cyclobacterium xiamenense]|uniref:Enamine deaminase RidA, house cleaning of reactive enamine intermediates, YjgF/YER057c/UK114 family n=2 Tax=Cyclobacterium xiamenense TaxID=1297121 RepID=A0A1H6YX02_9BACT|nr:Enamine deaminase RidA, house cleaning of reactive enamine intermediates, YjgF/YER057c/UK114 family [Cyclobacterium xiamenense]